MAVTWEDHWIDPQRQQRFLATGVAEHWSCAAFGGQAKTHCKLNSFFLEFRNFYAMHLTMQQIVNAVTTKTKTLTVKGVEV